MSDLAIQLIRENKKTQDPFLDLGNCGLTELPDELFDCVWLQRLQLGDWYFDDKYKFVKSSNKGLLNSLSSKDLQSLTRLTILQALYLRENKISDIRFIENLTQLQTLYLSRNKISDIHFLVNLTQLQALYLSENNISDIRFLEKLTQLQTLDLRYNNISDIRFLTKLTQLQTLYLSRNNISDIRFLEKCTQLQTLDLRYNNVLDYSFLEKLTQLQTLDLSYNKILDYSFLEKLTQLQTLYLSENKISDYSFLEKLTQLQILDLSENNITNIRFLGKLTQLQTLDLSENKISDYSFLENLTQLQTLYLRYNKISDIRFLEKLTQLQTLDLSENKISDISPLLPLLKRKNSPIVSLEAFDYRNKLNLYNNPLITPPIEIVQQGNEAVINYFAELEKQGIDYLYEAKMLIVGQPRAGKTSLRYKLFDQKAVLPVEDTTRGIDIQRLEFDITDQDNKLRTFKYNIWDFGGQQIYQSTHQFFLTHRSLYVLVMDTGKDSIGNDDSTMNYWLQAVELLGGNSPMLLLRNEKNERKFTIDLPTKKVRFPFLREDYGIDLNALIPGTSAYKADQEKTFKQLQKDIERALERLPLVGFPMPKNWVKIREELQQLSLQKPYITQQDYRKICEDHYVTEDEKQSELSRIFHDLGVFLHFQDHPALIDFIILQNVWATDAVFAVLDNSDVIANKGRFTDEDLSSIWRKEIYDSGVRRRLLELMKQFELCYQVENSSPRVYIVPEMLAKESPVGYSWISKNDFPLQYRYDFMPKGILTRLIVRLHHHIAKDKNDQQIVWKSGVKIDGTSLSYPNTFSEITEAWDNKQLLIRTQGKFSKELMSVITYEIDSINNDFFKQVSRDPASQKSRWYKMIPCNCRTCKDNVDKHFYDYDKLRERQEHGKNTVECDRVPYETVSISELLDGVFSKSIARQPENDRHSLEKNNVEKPAKKVFISYSHGDEKEWKDEMVKHIASLRNQDLIDSWTDREIGAGDWNAQIEQAMEEADIFLLLITHNFLASHYISSKEITTAYRRYKEGNAMIFPVICDSCAWQLQPVTKLEKEFNAAKNREMYVWLGKFQAFPKDALPIKEWPNIQKGFLDVINQLEKLL